MSSHPPTLPEQVVCAIRAAVGAAPAMLHQPSFKGNEWHYLKECLDSTFVSSVGKFVDRFEQGLAEFTGAKHAVAVVNGTAALHIALKLAGVTLGDEVLIPSLTFVATPNAVSYCNATPHFVDCEERTLGTGSIVMHGAIVNAGAKVGNNCIINTLALLEHDAVIGDHCHISTGAILNGGVNVGTGSFIGSGCVLKEGLSIGKDCLVGIGLTVRHTLNDSTHFTGHATS